MADFISYAASAQFCQLYWCLNLADLYLTLLSVSVTLSVSFFVGVCGSVFFFYFLPHMAISFPAWLFVNLHCVHMLQLFFHVFVCHTKCHLKAGSLPYLRFLAKLTPVLLQSDLDGWTLINDITRVSVCLSLKCSLYFFSLSTDFAWSFIHPCGTPLLHFPVHFQVSIVLI